MKASLDIPLGISCVIQRDLQISLTLDLKEYFKMV